MSDRERGGVKVFEGRVYARIRFGKNERFEERLPWAGPNDLESARERSRFIAELCDELVAGGRRDLVRSTAKEAARATRPKLLETIRAAALHYAKEGPAKADEAYTTFKDVADMWTSGDLKKKYPDHVGKKSDFRLERARLRRYIFPLVKDVPIVAFTKAHGDSVMAKLPPKRIKTSAARRQVAQIIGRVLNLAVMPLGLIERSPLPRGWLPRIERNRHYSCLFPKEEAKLLKCKDVDEAFRLFIGILDREGMRVSELVDAEWWQFNLDVGTFTATKTKTDDPRMWALRPDVARAMRLWADRYGKTKERPFIDVAPDKKTKGYLAKNLRAALDTAGVNRVELHKRTAHTGALRVHDMRATFVTISLAEGKSDAWIRDRTAHKTTAMIDRYRRQARQFEELNVGSLVDLVDGLGWGIAWVIRAAANGDETIETSEVSRSSGAGIRTPIGGSKRLRGAESVPPHPANADDLDGDGDPPEEGSPDDHPGLKRLPPDVQDFVFGQLEEAYRHAFGGSEHAVLAPLAKAAKAIERGRAPKRRRGAR